MLELIHKNLSIYLNINIGKSRPYLSLLFIFELELKKMGKSYLKLIKLGWLNMDGIDQSFLSFEKNSQIKLISDD